MRRYTTPILTMTIKGIDFSDGYKTVTTIYQDHVELDIDDVEFTSTSDGCTGEVMLSQEQSAMFISGKTAYVQIRYIDSEGIADATPIRTFTVEDVLKKGVIRYE